MEIHDRERRDIDDEEGGAIMHAVISMLHGDLLPLAQYLRAGYPLNYMVRRSLVEAIEGGLGEGLYTLKLAKNRRGAGDALSKIRIHVRQLEIGRYIERQLPLLNDDVEAAVHAAMREFGVKRTTAMTAKKAYGCWREEFEAAAAKWRRESEEKTK
jgi:hypothetical protein